MRSYDDSARVFRRSGAFMDESFDGPCGTRNFAARRRAIKRTTVRRERRAGRAATQVTA